MIPIPAAPDHAWNDAASSLYDDGTILLEDLRPLVPLHPQHIRKLARRGEFPAPIKIGGRTAFRRGDIRTWLQTQARRSSVGDVA